MFLYLKGDYDHPISWYMGYGYDHHIIFQDFDAGKYGDYDLRPNRVKNHHIFRMGKSHVPIFFHMKVACAGFHQVAKLQLQQRAPDLIQ